MNAAVDGLEFDFKAIAAEHGAVDWKTERGYILQAIDADWKLAKATPISLRNAILNIAKTGISISPLEGLAHLECRSINTETDRKKTPVYRNDAALKIGYKGMITSLVDCGAVNWMRADVVRQGDVFEYRGPAAMPVIKVADPFGAQRVEVVGSYAIAELPSGQIMCEIMRMEELEEVKKASKASSGPWMNGFSPEMMKKAVLNRLGKTIPRKPGSRADAIVHAASVGDGFEFENVTVDQSPQYTDDQLAAFNTAIKAKDGFQLIDLAADKNTWIALFNSPPDGKKVAVKQAVRDLMASARKDIEAAQIELCKMMESDDQSGAVEILDEIPWRHIEATAPNELAAWINTLETDNG